MKYHVPRWVNELHLQVWSLRDFALCGLRLESLDRHGPQSVDPIQDEAEHFPGYGNLGQLEDDVAGMADDLANRKPE